MDLWKEELERACRFFWDHANRNEESGAYGLIVDDTGKPQFASIASVGFGLSTLVIGVERGFIDRQTALRAARLTFLTFRDRVPHYQGFFMHFVDLATGAAKPGCEYSTIDTAIFLNGAVTADAYFADQELHGIFMEIYERVNWHAFIFEKNGRTLFRMAYNPVEGGDYRQASADPWIWQWDMMAEQLSLYALAAGAPSVSERLARALFAGFSRNLGRYGDYEYVYSPGNALFVYQYSHAWLDFGKYRDIDGFDWAENTRLATYGNRQWCIDHHREYPLLSEKIWGVSSCLTPKGYRGQGVAPTDNPNHPDGHFYGAIPPSGPLGSLPYAPEIVIPAVEAFYHLNPDVFGEYGFKDSIAIEDGRLWISSRYIGIDKGISALMIDNHFYGTTWKHYMAHPLIQTAVKKLGFSRKK
mgnify:CR=1 FL=1